MSRIYTSADQLIGKTPLLELSNIEKEYQLSAKLFAKLEYFNPAGSVKDRVAKAMLDDAEKKGILQKDSVIRDSIYIVNDSIRTEIKYIKEQHKKDSISIMSANDSVLFDVFTRYIEDYNNK